MSESKTPGSDRSKGDLDDVKAHGKHHHRETGVRDDIDKETPITDVKAPNVFERAKEEIEAIVEAIHPKKEAIVQNHGLVSKDPTRVTDKEKETKQQTSDSHPSVFCLRAALAKTSGKRADERKTNLACVPKIQGPLKEHPLVEGRDLKKVPVKRYVPGGEIHPQDNIEVAISGSRKRSAPDKVGTRADPPPKHPKHSWSAPDYENPKDAEGSLALMAEMGAHMVSSTLDKRAAMAGLRLLEMANPEKIDTSKPLSGLEKAGQACTLIVGALSIIKSLTESADNYMNALESEREKSSKMSEALRESLAKNESDQRTIADQANEIEEMMRTHGDLTALLLKLNESCSSATSRMEAVVKKVKADADQFCRTEVERAKADMEKFWRAEVEKAKADLALEALKYYYIGEKNIIRRLFAERSSTIDLDKAADWMQADPYAVDLLALHPIIPYADDEVESINQDKVGEDIWVPPTVESKNLDAMIAPKTSSTVAVDVVESSVMDAVITCDQGVGEQHDDVFDVADLDDGRQGAH